MKRHERYRKEAALIMLWYAIQTFTGKEEQLTEMIRRVVPERYFGECFVPYFERLRCWRQQNQIHILRLFPGYIFISTDTIEDVFQRLKKIPAMSKVLTAGAFEFTPLYDSEAEFLKEILDADHIVRLTYAATDGKGHVTYMAGPLEKCSGRIEAYKFRDRYAQVRLTIAGQEKTVRMGIILNNDVRREMAYGKVEAHIPAQGRYELGNTGSASLASGSQGNINSVSQASGSLGNANRASQASGTQGNTNSMILAPGSLGNANRASLGARPHGNTSGVTLASCRHGNGKSAALLRPGDHVAVVSGVFEGNIAVIREARSSTVSIAVHMFGREIPVEVSAEEVRKLESAD